MVEASVALAVAVYFVVQVLPRTYNYELKHGQRVVYRGVTKNLARRRADHQRDGKVFTHVRVTAWSFFRGLALRRERLALDRYRRAHRGQNPQYNRRNAG